MGWPALAQKYECGDADLQLTKSAPYTAVEDNVFSCPTTLCLMDGVPAGLHFIVSGYGQVK